MQAVYPCPDQTTDDLVNCTTRMKNCLVSMVVSLLREFSEPRHDEFVEMLGSAYEVTLSTEVVAEKEYNWSILTFLFWIPITLT